MASPCSQLVNNDSPEINPIGSKYLHASDAAENQPDRVEMVGVKAYDQHSSRTGWKMQITSVTLLGEVVRNQRKALDLTQIEAAGLCGVGERFLRELEHGKPSLEIGRVFQVLAGLGIELSATVRNE